MKKGAKALHILVPCFQKEVDEETGDDNSVLQYFKAMPVFRVEDTEGEQLDYESLELPDLPLLERAEELGISVKAVPGDCRFHGYYSSKRKEIGLVTPEEAVFFHELAHAGHDNVKGSMKPGQEPFQKIVAELSAQALCRLVENALNISVMTEFSHTSSRNAGWITIYPTCLYTDSNTYPYTDSLKRYFTTSYSQTYQSHPPKKK